ncbi:MAG: alpha/beta fold hydrolase [Pseudomonadales bacterium]|jgi:pimeloyl-ACP methyl ester carboxylesterase
MMVRWLVIWLMSLSMLVATAQAREGISLVELQEWVGESTSTQFEFPHAAVEQGGLVHQTVAFRSDGLNQFALIVHPNRAAPEAGWPILIFNHGYHPNPPEYGISADGTVSRPGDYYRGLVAAYAQLGYLVVAADYRGHNRSEGLEYTRIAYAAHYYTRDVIASYWAAMKLENVNTDQVVMAGHSMGGGITQRAVIALGDRLAAASIWSTAGEDFLRYWMTESLSTGAATDSNAKAKPVLDSLLAELRAGDYSFADLAVAPVVSEISVPLMIQHARDDQTTAVDNSIVLAAQLYQANKAYQLYLYDDRDHLFGGEVFDEAIRRDQQFFAKALGSDGD